MNNKLTMWYEPNNSEAIKAEVRERVKRQYGFSEGELVSIGGGFKFLFDDETNGEIEVTFTTEPNVTGLKVTVAGTWPWEVIEIYNLLPQYPGK
ncbi:hypothetical protein H7B90_23680 [Cohnella xylanilytica]|uniref:Uncharacterized protein n=1 Tax=Cohnella xylanilytica TaxID=557555 RepID=A0A841U4C8_9BACL|nr:hypothetical protein [Cohnella xylanilytica]MBB6694402.1 hypothetical protein [Cohnella xylanilytica]